MIATFVYRCPTTGCQVEGHEVDDGRLAPGPLKTYVAERCPACAGLHIVNPETGGLLAHEAQAFTRPFVAKKPGTASASSSGFRPF